MVQALEPFPINRPDFMEQEDAPEAENKAAEIKVAAAQMDVTPSDPEKNVAKMIQFIEDAKKEGVEILTFPEMCVAGYFLSDDWLNDSLVKDYESYNEDILKATEGSDMVVVWGNIKTDDTKKNEDGSIRKYNAAYVAQNGTYAASANKNMPDGVMYKTALPNYGEFDDKRYFHSLKDKAAEDGELLSEQLNPFDLIINGVKRKIGVVLCEDQWASGENGDYSENPVQTVIDNGAEMVINLSCSPWKFRKNDKRTRVVRKSLDGAEVPELYCNNVGTQNIGKNILPFDGASTIYNLDGSIQHIASAYEEELVIGSVELKDQESEITPDIPEFKKSKDPEMSKEIDTKELCDALVYGIKKFFEDKPFKKVIIGMSGGADSALVATLLVKALGAENVYGVNMPTEFNTEMTKGFAETQAKAMGINYLVAPIQEMYESTVSQFESYEFERLDDSKKKEPIKLKPLDLENTQARLRGNTILSGIAAALGGVFTNNGNKLESAMGYCTVDGDLAGAIAPLGDIWKSEVYDLLRHLATTEDLPVLNEVANSVPSAELSADQNPEEGNGDPFVPEYHDCLIRSMVEFRRDPEDLLSMYKAGTLESNLLMETGIVNRLFPAAESFIDDLERCYKLFKNNVFKRVQGQPVIRVSRKGFGYDLRESMPQGPIYFTRNYRSLKSQLLSTEGGTEEAA